MQFKRISAVYSGSHAKRKYTLWTIIKRVVHIVATELLEVLLN
jgi:hypothetical protein